MFFKMEPDVVEYIPLPLSGVPSLSGEEIYVDLD